MPAIDGGLGVDTLSYQYATTSGTTGVTLDLSLLNGAGQAVASGISGADLIRGVENLIGSNYADVLKGNAGANVLNGGAGADSLFGGELNDILIGGSGKDYLTGGAGNDIFRFTAVSDTGITSAAWDVVNDFVRGLDKIDLGLIDANAATIANDAFTGLIGSSQAFSAAGQLKISGGVLYGNTDLDVAAELAIQLTGISTLATTDFLL